MSEVICTECKYPFEPYKHQKEPYFCTQQCKKIHANKQANSKQPAEKKKDIQRSKKISRSLTDPWPVNYHAWKRSQTCRG